MSFVNSINNLFYQFFIIFVFINILCPYPKNDLMDITIFSMMGIFVSEVYKNDKLEHASLIILFILYWGFVSHKERYLTTIKLMMFLVILGFNLTVVSE